MSKDTQDLATQVVKAVGKLDKSDTAASFMLAMFANSQRGADDLTVYHADELSEWGAMLTALGGAVTDSAQRFYERSKP